MNKVSVTIDILGKMYYIRCNEQDVDALKVAASALSDKLQKMQAAGNIINFDRMAVLAALNLTHQVMDLEEQNKQLTCTVEERLREIYSKVEAALARNAQMEFASE